MGRGESLGGGGAVAKSKEVMRCVEVSPPAMGHERLTSSGLTFDAIDVEKGDAVSALSPT